MKTETAARLREAAGVVRRWFGEGRRFPEVGVVLGSGLAGAADAVSDARSLPYREIPGLRECSAPGHRSRLVTGALAGDSGTRLEVAMLLGRHHLYEGWTPGLPTTASPLSTPL